MDWWVGKSYLVGGDQAVPITLRTRGHTLSNELGTFVLGAVETQDVEAGAPLAEFVAPRRGGERWVGGGWVSFL